MAGLLPKSPDQFHRIPGAKLAIIGSMWHRDCVDGMISVARSELIRLGVSDADISVHNLPGSLELPLAARILFEQQPELDGILAFGVVLTGGTYHNQSVLHGVVQGFALVSDHFRKPIINEVIGVTSIDDAVSRSRDDASNKGIEAAFACSELINWRRNLARDCSS